MSDDNEPFGPPRPLEMIEREPTLHRSAMAVLMQGGWRPYSDVLVVHYLKRRPDMTARVEEWRLAGKAVLEQRKAAWQADARQQERLNAARREEERREAARRLALSHVDGLTADERFDQRLAQRLQQAAAREPDVTKRIELLGEAYALLNDETRTKEGD